jgi:hypothetical protein
MMMMMMMMMMKRALRERMRTWWPFRVPSMSHADPVMMLDQAAPIAWRVL